MKQSIRNGAKQEKQYVREAGEYVQEQEKAYEGEGKRKISMNQCSKK